VLFVRSAFYNEAQRSYYRTSLQVKT
jgi:hypothetical protein